MARIRWQPLRRLGLVSVYAGALLLGIVVQFIQLPEPPPEYVLRAAEYQSLPAIDAEPGDHRFEGVALPHRCQDQAGQSGCFGRYRLSFEADPADPEPRALYLPTFPTRAVVRVNGVLLEDSAWLQPPAIAGLEPPLIAALPSPVLQRGVNRLDITIAALPLTGGHLSAVYIGPDAVLRPAYDQRQFHLATVPRLQVAWIAALALALLFAAAVRRDDPTYGFFCLIILNTVVGNLPLVLPPLDFPADVQNALDLIPPINGVLAVPFVCYLVGRQPPGKIYLFLLLPATAIVAYFILPQRTSYFVTMRLYLPIMLLPFAASGAVVAEAAFRRGNRGAHAVLAAMLFVLPLLAADALDWLGTGNAPPTLRIRYGVPLVMTVVAATLMARFATALNQVSQFNLRLRREIKAAEVALRTSFEREQRHIRAAALDAERSRLTRDLHDGLAGQLMSVVAQSELGGERFGAIGASARRALEDLRLVIASLDDLGDDLALVLARFREQIEPQLRSLGISLDWRMVPLPEVRGLGSAGALDLFRILQEATNNAARHSGSRALTIDMGPAPPETAGYAVRITIADHGRGGAVERPGGHGVANMRHRAAAIGASLAIVSGPSGTVVILNLPETIPARPDDPLD